MSADNWRECLRCHASEEKRIATLEESVKALYGKVTPEAYMALVAKVEKEKGKELDHTLREDYEFYWEGPDLRISYACSCRVCGFSFSLNESRSTKILEAE